MNYERAAKFIQENLHWFIIVLFIFVQYIIIVIYHVYRKLLVIVRNAQDKLNTFDIQFHMKVLFKYNILFRFIILIASFFDLLIIELLMDALIPIPIISFAINWLMGYILDQLVNRFMEIKYKRQNIVRSGLNATETIWNTGISLLGLISVTLIKLLMSIYLMHFVDK
ncbi:hypothetical protein I4U23_004819 [Adineta vaga]|nr:hypothetical protein I4U23_004819 [Adineta vaga]